MNRTSWMAGACLAMAAAAAGLGAWCAGMRGELDAARVRVAEAARSSAELRGRADGDAALARSLAAESNRAAAAAAALEEERRTHDPLRLQIEEMVGREFRSQQNLMQREAEVARLARLVSDHEARIGMLSVSTQKMGRAVATLTAGKESADQATSGLRSQLASAQAACAALSNDLASARGRIAALEKQGDAARAERDALAAQMADVRERLRRAAEEKAAP